MSLKTVAEPAFCSDCDKQLYNRKSVKDHWWAKHSAVRPVDVQLQCPLCPKICAKRSYYTRHLLEHRTKMLCDKCGTSSHTFKDRGSMKRHLALRHGLRKIFRRDSQYRLKFKCETCSARFLDKYSYNIHLRIHMAVRERVQCTMCPAKLATRSSLYSHMQNSHLEGAKPVCNECGLEVRHQRALTHHKTTNHQPRILFTCAECPATYLHRSSMENHSSKHSLGHLNCRFCQAVFPKRKGAFQTHLKKHRDVYDFLCDICGKQWKLKNGLTEHLLRHQGRFVFYCADCGAEKKSKQTLFSHSLQKHQGVKLAPISKKIKSKKVQKLCVQVSKSKIQQPEEQKQQKQQQHRQQQHQQQTPQTTLDVDVFETCTVNLVPNVANNSNELESCNRQEKTRHTRLMTENHHRHEEVPAYGSDYHNTDFTHADEYEPNDNTQHQKWRRQDLQIPVESIVGASDQHTQQQHHHQHRKPQQQLLLHLQDHTTCGDNLNPLESDFRMPNWDQEIKDRYKFDSTSLIFPPEMPNPKRIPKIAKKNTISPNRGLQISAVSDKSDHPIRADSDESMFYQQTKGDDGIWNTT